MKRPLFLYAVPIVALGSVLSACSSSRKANAAPPTTAPTPMVRTLVLPVGGGKPSVDQLDRVENEPILKEMQKIFSETRTDQMNAAIIETRAALLKALRGRPQDGIDIQVEKARFANYQGYMVPVIYKDRAAYERFSGDSFQNPESPFRTWKHGAGRTGLALYPDGRLGSSIFFMVGQRPSPARLRQDQYKNESRRTK
ncbi:MAG: hypothetical protein ABIS92_07675 [Polyangia bacterium]